MFKLILTQTVAHAFRKGGGAFGTMGFYVIVMTLFAFALGPEDLARLAGPAMCVAMLLAGTVAMPLMFERDHEDGTLEQYLLQPAPLELMVLAKILGQWLAILLPILAVSPALCLISGMAAEDAARVMTALSLAAPTLVSVNALSAALTLGARRGGLLQSLIALPLTVPLLIFAATAGQGAILFLSAMALAALPISCWVCAALIRMAGE